MVASRIPGRDDSWDLNKGKVAQLIAIHTYAHFLVVEVKETKRKGHDRLQIKQQSTHMTDLLVFFGVWWFNCVSENKITHKRSVGRRDDGSDKRKSEWLYVSIIETGSLG